MPLCIYTFLYNSSTELNSQVQSFFVKTKKRSDFVYFRNTWSDFWSKAFQLNVRGGGGGVGDKKNNQQSFVMKFQVHIYWFHSKCKEKVSSFFKAKWKDGGGVREGEHQITK